MKIIKIEATACDNEMWVIVSQSPVPSSELFHIKSGYGDPVSYHIRPQAVLAPGAYTLTVIGLNWTGPANFKVILTPDTGAPITLSGGTSTPGGVWSATHAITV